MLMGPHGNPLYPIGGEGKGEGARCGVESATLDDTLTEALCIPSPCAARILAAPVASP